MKTKLLILILLASIFHFIFRIYTYRQDYLSSFDPNYWKNRYLQSQWVNTPGCGDFDPHINPKTCVWDDGWYAANNGKLTVNQKKINSIGDDGLYTYAGWEYVKGKDPTLLNAEMPPLGKYLIGLSALVFGNQNIFALLSGIFVLFSFYLLNTQVFKDKLLAALPIALFSFEPLFYEQLRAPFLDLLYLAFLLLTFYFLFKEKFLLFAIYLGLMMATKASSATFVTVVVSALIFLFLSKKFMLIKRFSLFLPVAILTFTLTYFRFFWLGHNLREFLGVQKWILNFYSIGAKGSFGSIWEMLIIGKWQTWWGKIDTVAEWQITWPILLLLSIIYLYISIRNKKFENHTLYLTWSIIYLIFLSLIPIFPRYLLLVIPFFYSLSILVLFKNLKNFKFKN